MASPTRWEHDDTERNDSTWSSNSPINYSLSPNGSYKPKLPLGSIDAGSPLAFHPDIRNPGLEPLYDQDQGKEVVPPEEQTPFYPDQKITTNDGSQDYHKGRRRRICGIPMRIFWLLIAILIILAVALGVGLGVGLGSSSHSSSGSGPRKYYSTSGAFNGTGIALASYSFGSGGYGVINIYFQHWTGQIRKMQLMQDGTWQGGDQTNVVATDAKNGTPISAVAYAMDGKATWNIFYIDKTNILRQKVSDNTTNQWRDGTLGNLNLKAMDSDAVGLQACWYGNFYGGSSYVHSPVPGTGGNTSSPDSVVGMHLWYGSDSVTVPEYSWTYNTTNWVYQETFTANGHAGVGCYSWGGGSNSYVMTVNLNNDVQVMWKDLNSSVTATASHPVNKWVNTTFTIDGVQPNTSLGYTNYFYTQLQDNSIAGYNLSFNAENTSIMSSQNFKIPEKALPGSHFSVTSLVNPSGGNSIWVFDQRNGSDITVNSRDLGGGPWNYNTLPIPAT